VISAANSDHPCRTTPPLPDSHIEKEFETMTNIKINKENG
jgi:hypothetical protein